MSEHQLEHERTYHLHHGEDACERVFILHAEVQDHTGNHHAYDGAYRIDQLPEENSICSHGVPRLAITSQMEPTPMTTAAAHTITRRAVSLRATKSTPATSNGNRIRNPIFECHAASPFRLSSTFAHSARNKASCGARTSDTVGHFSIAGRYMTATSARPGRFVR